jgi:outer membrane protein TolC
MTSVRLVVLLWIGTVVRLIAADAATNLTLAAAVDTAVRDNAQLLSLRARWAAERERPVQARALPNPMLTYSGMDTAEGGDWPGGSERRIMVQQAFPWFGKRDLRSRIAEKEADAMRHELDAMTRDVVMRVQSGFYSLSAETRAIALTRDEIGVLGRMAEIAKSLYETGAREQVDLIQAQSEVTLLRQRLLERIARETTLRARLNALMNRRADAALPPLAPPPTPAIPPEAVALFDQAATNSPDVLAAQTQVERYELERRLMQKESLPDYSLGFEYRDIRDDDNMAMFTIGVELPIHFEKNRAGVREAEHMREASQANREAAERENAFEIQDARFRIETAQRTLDLVRRELIPQAEARLNAHEVAYRTGKADFLDFLGSERLLLDTRLMAIEAEAELGLQAARLEQAAGLSAYALPPR